MKRIPMALLFAMVFVLCTHAREMRTTRSAVIREGPAAFYPMVQRIPAATVLEVGKRDGGWCAVRAGAVSGWVPYRAFKKPRAGYDYDGLLNSAAIEVISPVDITAATKGMVESTYAQKHNVSMVSVDQIDKTRIPAELVAELRGSLSDRGAARLLVRLPKSAFTNEVILTAEAENMLGRAIAARLLADGLVKDEQLVQYVNAVAALIGEKTERPTLGYRVGIVDSDAINGFGIPGGYVLLYRGLLAEVRDEAELACLLAHEMAHASLYHGTREFEKRKTHRKRDSMFAELEAETATGEVGNVEQDLDWLMSEGYLKNVGVKRSQADELQADLHGVAYASAAGYDPGAMLDLLGRIQSRHSGKDMFLHHPPVSERIRAVRKAVSRYGLKRRGQSRFVERYRAHVRGVLAARARERDAE